MTDFFNATVIKNDRVSDTLCLITVKPDFEVKDFKPGQFTTLGLMGKKDGHEKLVKRAYSVASSPAQTSYLEFYIALVPNGKLSPYLFNLKQKDRLFVGEKFVGKFTLDTLPEHKHLLMISTGTGLAPFLSMIRTHLICGGDRHFAILHGARYSYELGFYSELAVMSVNCKNFNYIPCISRPEKDPFWGGPKGRVTEVIKKDEVKKQTGIELTPDNFEVLLCGNPAMITEMTDHLTTLGFKENTKDNPGTIHTEKYW
jgi:ferredoxin/flavodoxin---NADP+ reductase